MNERITTSFYEGHVKYSNGGWLVGTKAVSGSSLTQTSMPGGFGIESIDKQTRGQRYTPIQASNLWLNVVHGQKRKPGIFLGYIKSPGTSGALASGQPHGTGTNVDQVVTAGVELAYNANHWKFGVEYIYTSAAYGSLNLKNGRTTDTYPIGNNRIVGVVMLMF